MIHGSGIPFVDRDANGIHRQSRRAAFVSCLNFYNDIVLSQERKMVIVVLCILNSFNEIDVF